MDAQLTDVSLELGMPMDIPASGSTGEFDKTRVMYRVYYTNAQDELLRIDGKPTSKFTGFLESSGLLYLVVGRGEDIRKRIEKKFKTAGHEIVAHVKTPTIGHGKCKTCHGGRSGRR